MKTPTITPIKESEKEATINDLKQTIKDIKSNLDIYSLNRYINPRLTQVDFTKITPRNWYIEESIMMDENPIMSYFIPITLDIESFLYFLQDFAKKEYQLDLNEPYTTDPETGIHSDIDYLELLARISIDNKIAKLCESYNNQFQTEIKPDEFEHVIGDSFSVAKFGMQPGDHLTLKSFISLYVQLYKLHNAETSLHLIENGTLQLYKLDI